MLRSLSSSASELSTSVVPLQENTVAVSSLLISSRVPVCIRESVDSLCRDGADMPMPLYIRKACNCPNTAFVSLFR